MTGGFTFCGTDIAALGLEYVPETKSMYVFSGTSVKINEETFDAHDGGYFYGVTRQPKEFTLRCMFQNQEITKGTIAKIDSFFRRGRTGKLVFDNLDWLWYTATVTNVDFSGLLNRKNGLLQITMKAYYPFARHDNLYLSGKNAFDAYILENSGLLTEEETPITEFADVTNDLRFLLYNPGSERAAVAIALSGDAGEGVTITNHTTGQEVRMAAFNKAQTTDAGKSIVCDAMNGKVVLTDGVTSEPAFLYHDAGYLELAPAFPILRDVGIQTTAGELFAKVPYEEVNEDMIGKFVYMDNDWNKIQNVTEENELVLQNVALTTESRMTNIVTMNEITVTLGAGADLSSLEFRYLPTFQ